MIDGYASLITVEYWEKSIIIENCSFIKSITLFAILGLWNNNLYFEYSEVQEDPEIVNKTKLVLKNIKIKEVASYNYLIYAVSS